jgi:hypothetical protein
VSCVSDTLHNLLSGVPTPALVYTETKRPLVTTLVSRNMVVEAATTHGGVVEGSLWLRGRVAALYEGGSLRQGVVETVST